MLDVALPGQQQFDLLGVDIEAQRPKAGPNERLDQRQAHVAQSDNADFSRLFVDRFPQDFCGGRGSCSGRAHAANVLKGAKGDSQADYF